MRLRDQAERLEPEFYPIRFSIRVRYGDLDTLRHVNNCAFARYFEEGRSELNARIFGVERMLHQIDGLQILLANLTIEFLYQAFYPGEVVVASAVERIGGSSIGAVQAVFQNQVCAALATSVIVKAIDRRPVPLDELEREALGALMAGREIR